MTNVEPTRPRYPGMRLPWQVVCSAAAAHVAAGTGKCDARGRSEMGLCLVTVICLGVVDGVGRLRKPMSCPPMDGLEVLSSPKAARSSPTCTDHRTRRARSKERELWSSRRAVVLIGGRHKGLTLNQTVGAC
jgi:hypothetical protein